MRILILRSIRCGFCVLSVLFFLSSCQKPNKNKNHFSSEIDETLILKVTKDNFINGKTFCQLYVNTNERLSRENGVWIDVPKTYDKQKNNNDKMQIYAYTRKPFDPKLPSFVFVDGGPGQNTHQFEDILSDGYNQINFDQRGVGCSTPNTWEEYSDQNLYSSKNTVYDMEEIRKHFGIEKWSVYGLSYGTIPATMYSSFFKGNTKVLVLEGVVGSVENLSRFSYFSDKWNLVIKSFNEKQKNSFDQLILNDKEKKFEIIMQQFMIAGYRDAGFKSLKENLLDKLFPPDGGFNEDVFKELKRSYTLGRTRFEKPQQPGAVDDNILSIFYCKELKAFEKDKFTLDYDPEKGFIERPTTLKKYWRDECYKHDIKEENQDSYEEAKYPVLVPIYYLQGSHDAATVATGALNHWKVVPKKSVFFMFSLKGGHNPGLSKINSLNEEIKLAHRNLYIKALNGEKIDSEFIKNINSIISKNETNENLKKVTWELFLKRPKDFSSIEGELEGIKRIQY